MAVDSKEIFFKLFKDGPSFDMNVDGSVNPVAFDVVVDADFAEIFVLTLAMIDSGITEAGFGGLSELPNGLTVQLLDKDDIPLGDLLEGFTIRRNIDWSLVTGTNIKVSQSSGDDTFSMRWTMADGLGTGIRLKTGNKVRITVNDDLTPMTKFGMSLQGRR